MTELDLTPIKARLARARHLPIFLTEGDIAKARENRKGLYRWHLEGTWDDAVLFGRARDDIAALVAEVERLRAQVQREAAVKALREAADAALAVREAHCKVCPWPGSLEWSEVAHEYGLTRVAFEQLRESPWGWIMDRADRMEAGE